jgi:hypothetical protein
MQKSDAGDTTKDYSQHVQSFIVVVSTVVYICVSVCMFCAVRFLIIIYFFLLFSNYWTYFFNILFMYLFCIFIFCVFNICYVLFRLLYIAVTFILVHKSTNHCHRLETQSQYRNTRL